LSGVWDPLSPALDASPPRDPALPVRAYFVCATPRSGSGLLCRALARTGRAGAPAEYFNLRKILSRRWGVDRGLDSYLPALRARRTGENGVFGMKVHWEHLKSGDLAVLERPFPEAAYVLLRREDATRQAVSLWTAVHTGVWAVGNGTAPTPAQVPYSFSAIHWQRARILAGSAGWEGALARAGVEPLRVSYEELTQAFAPTVARVFEHVTGSPLSPRDVPAPESRKLGGDSHYEELVRRFETDLASGRAPLPVIGRARTAVVARRAQ
jgi:trehalose 2-sulfotransferase